MSTPLSDLLSLVAAHGKSQASAFNQGEQSFTGTPQEEIVEFVSRQDVEWDSLPIADRDRIYDEYIQAVQQEMARRLVSSDPVTSSRLFKPVADQCPECGLSGTHFCTGGQAPHPGWSDQDSPLPVSVALCASCGVDREDHRWASALHAVAVNFQ